jgi:hypothetical protein
MSKRVTALDLHEMMPETGDKIIIINTGHSFEVYTIELGEPPLFLTDEEIDLLTRGEITFQ